MKLFECFCVDNFFSDSDLVEIWSELDQCHTKNLFSDDAKPFSLDKFCDGDNKILKSVHGLCETHTSKFFDLHLNHRCMAFTKFSETYINSCINNIEPPAVAGIPTYVTVIFWLCKDSEKIKGGDVFFEEINQTFEFKNNRLLMFLSHAKHLFTPVISESNSIKDGKHSITTYMY